MHTYEINLEWEEGRQGTASSPVLTQTVAVATPPEFPKGVPGIWSPEHLFVASVSSCFMTTFLAIAENSNVEFFNLEVNAVGTLDKVDGKFQITEITLRPKVTISSQDQTERITRIMEKSEAACLISNSIKTKVHLEPTVIVR